MVNTLSSVVTRSSESKYCYASVHPRVDEQYDNNNSNCNRNNPDSSVWWSIKQLDWKQCYSNLRNIWRNNSNRYGIRYTNSWKRIPVRNRDKICWSIRADRCNKKHHNKRYYYFLIGLLSIGSPVYAEGETNNTSNPVAAATGNVTNQAVQFQNNGAQSRQYFGPNISCNWSTMTFSPFYMGNHTEPRTWNDDIGGLRQESYTKGENWGFQINFMVPLDRQSLKQCRLWLRDKRRR